MTSSLLHLRREIDAIIEETIIGQPRSQQRAIGPSQLGIPCDMSVEEWRGIPGVEWAYEVSSHGRVRSLDRYVPMAPSGKLRFHRGRILAQNTVGADRGYLGLTIAGRPGKQRVHRLVAEAFLGLGFPGDERDVDHLDENKLNNRVDNLEVVTHAENMARYSDRKSECNKGHALTPENTYRNPQGYGRCRTCMREHDRRRDAAGRGRKHG